MMGRQRGQISLLVLDIEELIPGNHLLRKINQLVSFDFIHDLVAPYCPANGCPSVDPASMIKMLPWDIHTVSSQSVGLSKKSS